MNKSEEKFIKKYVKLSNQARGMIKLLPKFNMDNFIEWWINTQMSIGGQHIMNYLEEVGKHDNKNN